MLSRLKESQRQQAQQAEQVLESFKKQVELSSEKAYSDMKQQVSLNQHFSQHLTLTRTLLILTNPSSCLRHMPVRLELFGSDLSFGCVLSCRPDRQD